MVAQPRRQAGRLGRLTPRHDPRTLRLRRYLNLPMPPPSRSWDHGIVNWGMMRNDTVGDCTCAAIGHAEQVVTANAQNAELTISGSAVIAAYSAITGYNPATGANDTGANELDVLKYWQQTGVAGHKIAAFAQCAVGNPDDVRACINLFGFCYIGFAVPASAMQQFENHQAWDVVANDGGIEGGHAVIVVDYDAPADRFTVVTWGGLQQMTGAFWVKYVDEAWGVVTTEWIEANGQSPSGLNLQSLLTDVQQLTQDPTPVPTPTPTPPQPDPVLLRWTAWEATVAAYIDDRAKQMDLASVKVWQNELAYYGAQVAAYVNGRQFSLPSLPRLPR